MLGVGDLSDRRTVVPCSRRVDQVELEERVRIEHDNLTRAELT